MVGDAGGGPDPSTAASDSLGRDGGPNAAGSSDAGSCHAGINRIALSREVGNDRSSPGPGCPAGHVPPASVRAAQDWSQRLVAAGAADRASSAPIPDPAGSSGPTAVKPAANGPGSGMGDPEAATAV